MVAWGLVNRVNCVHCRLDTHGCRASVSLALPGITQRLQPRQKQRPHLPAPPCRHPSTHRLVAALAGHAFHVARAGIKPLVVERAAQGIGAALQVVEGTAGRALQG